MKIRNWAICLILSASPLFLRADRLKGTKAVARSQNIEADREDLTRLADQEQLEKFKQATPRILVPLPENMSVKADPRLKPALRFCRPWTAQFLTDLGKEFFAKFHEPIQVNSAVRTVVYQQKLARKNGNAAPAFGDRRSSHLTGATVDIAKKDLTREELVWLRAKLIHFQSSGIIIVVEEHTQLCFHVMVFGKYSEYRRTVLANEKERGQ